MLDQYPRLKVHKKNKVHPDQKYIIALRDNDKFLIEEIYKKCSGMITKMIIQNNGTKTEAKDLFQEILISLFKQSQSGFQLTCPLEQFVFIVSKRKWINTLRQKKIVRIADFQEFQMLTGSDDHEDRVNAFLKLEEKEKMVNEKFQFLGPSCKEILKLSWTKNEDGKFLSWKEIASDLDLSYGYVRKKAAECKTRLIEIIKKDPLYKSLI